MTIRALHDKGTCRLVEGFKVQCCFEMRSGILSEIHMGGEYG
jgi:hypothetical protein